MIKIDSVRVEIAAVAFTIFNIYKNQLAFFTENELHRMVQQQN